MTAAEPGTRDTFCSKPVCTSFGKPVSHFLSSSVIAAYLCVSVSIAFLIISPKCSHWFIIPVTLCGIVIARDAVDWIRGHFGIFDPRGVIGVLGIHFFFLAPLLHVHWDYWLPYVPDVPSDWRSWVGWMAVLNLVGLVIYQAARTLPINTVSRAECSKTWEIRGRRFAIVLAFALIITGLLQLAVYEKYGGILPYIHTAIEPGTLNTMQGMGFIFLISESFPSLAMMAFVYFAHGKLRYRSVVWISLALISYFILCLFFGGLRGSRSNTIWSLFIAVGMIHYWVRPFTKKAILGGLAFLVIFMYFYGFIKGAGVDGLQALVSEQQRAELSESTGRGWDTVLLGDLGRTDVQAFLLYRLTTADFSYEYALGRTYVGAAALLIPRQIYPDRPPTKVREGTEALYGQGSYIPDRHAASRIYGLAGETMLNFGPFLVPLAFGVWGLIVGWVGRMMRIWEYHDARYLFVPILVNLCFWLLAADSDNILFFIIKRFTVPFLVLILAVVRRPTAESRMSQEFTHGLATGAK